MLTIRKADERGTGDHGWLFTRHTFSFGDYHDPSHMGFGALRVINDDVVHPGRGFGLHPHRDMEIITYVISGALEHTDSTGARGVIRPGDVQAMTAGRGIFHSEMNPSDTEPVRLLQVWIRPERRGLDPSYSQKHFPLDSRRNTLRLIAGGNGDAGALRIQQDAGVYAAVIDAGCAITQELAAGRRAWLQVARGEVTLNGTHLREGDGAALSEEPRLEIAALKEAEVLLFDLA